jgi:ribosomal protein S8
LRISKPIRVYINSKELPKVLDDLGIAIIYSKGVMTNLKAKELGLVAKFYVTFGKIRSF